MSSNTSYVIFPDGKVMFGIQYNGTDVALPALHDEPAGLERVEWQQCGEIWHEFEDVVYCSHQGASEGWRGKACRECKTFEGPHCFDEEKPKLVNVSKQQWRDIEKQLESWNAEA